MLDLAIRPSLERLEEYVVETIDADIVVNANESNYPLPEAVRSEIEAETGKVAFNRYPPMRGDSLRVLIADALGIDPDKVRVGNGSSELLQMACYAFGGIGRRIAVPYPSFSMYSVYARLSDSDVLQYPLTVDGFLDAEALIAFCRAKRPHLLIINNPNNPTGAVYQKETLEQLCKLARENNILILADEIYNQLDYENQYVSIASFENMKDYTIIVNGFSKAYAMTGWRMGYIASSQKHIDQILKVHQYTTTSQMTFAQIGMANAIDQEDVKKEVQHMVDTFALRRTFIMEQLDQCKNLFYIKPHGAFYIMVDVSKTGLNGQEFADKLLEYGVAVVPANGFGKDFSDFIRISFASSKENIAEAFVRIRKLLNDLNKEAC